MSQQYDNTNRGIISKNDRKTTDKHPDIKGSINVDGVEYWLDGWKKEGSRGPFYSLSVKPKDGGAVKNGTLQPSAASTKTYADAVDDSDIPF